MPRRQLVGHLAREARFASRGLGSASIDRLRMALLRAAAGLEREPVLEVVDEIAPAISREVFPAARWMIEQHLAAGHLVVLLSSSPHELVAAIAREIDPAIVPVGTLAEVVDARFTGRLAAPFCHGEGKLTRLAQEIGPRDLGIATAYADSASDEPVLRACGSPVAVNPDRPLRSIATTEGWPIFDLG
jgi:HAD superfamily hydrolase (TIGR01490 family)